MGVSEQYSLIGEVLAGKTKGELVALLTDGMREDELIREILEEWDLKDLLQTLGLEAGNE